MATRSNPSDTTLKKRKDWTLDEHELFLKALDAHGKGWTSVDAKDWSTIAKVVPTRTPFQVKRHAKVHFAHMLAAQSENTAKSAGKIWTPEEQAQFLLGYKQHSTAWSRVAEFVPTRTSYQAQRFYYRHRQNLEKQDEGAQTTKTAKGKFAAKSAGKELSDVIAAADLSHQKKKAKVSPKQTIAANDHVKISKQATATNGEGVVERQGAGHIEAGVGYYSVAEEIKKFSELHDKGILSASEFADAKKRLLAKL
jgi:hypothetical protein